MAKRKIKNKTNRNNVAKLRNETKANNFSCRWFCTEMQTIPLLSCIQFSHCFIVVVVAAIVVVIVVFFSLALFLFALLLELWVCVLCDLCVLCTLLMALVMERVNRSKHTKKKKKHWNPSSKPISIVDYVETKQQQKINSSLYNVRIVEFISNRLEVASFFKLFYSKFLSMKFNSLIRTI